VYLDRLKDTATRHNVPIHAFVLMTHHIDLLMIALSNPGISQVIRVMRAIEI
jgi:REP element-mobilizing transposase RayT